MKTRMMAALLAGSSLASGETPKATVVVEPKVETAVAPPVKTKIVGNPEAGGTPNVTLVAPDSDESTEPAKTPDVEAAIPDPVKALGKPAMMNFPNGIRMAVTATTENVQAHVNQGMNHLHGGWEFEASR